MRRRFANRRVTEWPLGRRLIALAVAYAIALSSLIANFDAARIAVPALGAITCHSEADGTTAPTGSQPDGKFCDASCCVGCLMAVAALPPPPAKVTGAPRSSGRLLAVAAVIDFRSDPQTKSHQSRAPPRAA